MEHLTRRVDKRKRVRAEHLINGSRSACLPACRLHCIFASRIVSSIFLFSSMHFHPSLLIILKGSKLAKEVPTLRPHTTTSSSIQMSFRSYRQLRPSTMWCRIKARCIRDEHSLLYWHRFSVGSPCICTACNQYFIKCSLSLSCGSNMRLLTD